MIPLSITHRRLISKYIPQVKCKEISKYESLLALHQNLWLESKLIHPTVYSSIFSNLLSLKEEVNKEASAIFDPVKTEIELVTKLWLARREFALIQGNFHQIPTNWKDMWLFTKKLLKYYALEFYALPILWLSKIRGFFWSIFSKDV